MRQCGMVNVIVYYPRTEKDQNELSRRIASIHGNAVIAQIKQLKCPAEQKLKLLESIILQKNKEKGEKYYGIP